MNNAIIEFLNLKEEAIESLSCHRLGEDLYVELSLKRNHYECPKCGHLTHKVLNQYTRVFNHGIFIGRKCIVHYKQKRYKCHVCGHTFNQPCQLVAKHQKKSLSSYIQIMELLKDPHFTFRKVADLLTLSDKTVMDTFYKNLPEHHPVLPRVLCIDEVYLGSNAIKKYVAILLDFETHDIVDIIYGRTKDSLHSYFQKFPQQARDSVKYLSSDMFEGYRTLQGTYFKKARLCVDSFHVIQLINEMFNKQLKAIMKDFDKDSDEYYLLKHKRFILLKNGDSIDWFKQEYNHKLGYYIYLMKYRERLFNINPIIKEIYDLKEAYIKFNQLKDREAIKNQCEIIIKKFVSHPNVEGAKVGRTLNKWKS